MFPVFLHQNRRRSSFVVAAASASISSGSSDEVIPPVHLPKYPRRHALRLPTMHRIRMINTQFIIVSTDKGVPAQFAGGPSFHERGRTRPGIRRTLHHTALPPLPAAIHNRQISRNSGRCPVGTQTSRHESGDHYFHSCPHVDPVHPERHWRLRKWLISTHRPQNYSQSRHTRLPLLG